MKIIVGLGNPGRKYENNRHNVGFQFVDYIIENLQIQNSKSQDPNKFQIPNFKFQKNLSAKIYQMTSNIILAKPLTFMNLSGQAIKKIIENYKLKIENLIIVHDDLDVPLGKFRIDFARGPKLHNGTESIEQHLKTKDFWRVRIGVDNRQQTGWIDGETYVLQDFLPEEKEITTKLFPKIYNRLLTIHPQS